MSQGFMGEFTAAFTKVAFLNTSLFTDVVAGSATRGDVIVANSTPAWARVAIGANGTVFQSNGTDPSWNNNLTAAGNAHVFGTAGTAPTLTVGQGTTGSDAAILRIRSGNSGTTAPQIYLNRNGTDLVQLATNGTNTFLDYTGSLTLRTGIAGTSEATLSAAGVLSVLTGYQIGGAAASANYLRGDGTNFVAAAATANDDFTQYTKIAGRTSTTNDTTLSTSAGGTLYGSTVTANNLTIRANSADLTTGTVAAPSPNLTVGTAGNACTATIGQGTTSTDATILRVRSGNSGTTAPQIYLNRNGTDLIQVTTDGTNSFVDYTGLLKYRTGIGGTVVASLDTSGELLLGGTGSPSAMLHLPTNGTIGHIRMGGIAGNPASPTAGDLWYNTTQKSQRMQSTVGTGGIGNLVYTVVASSNAINNTGTETAFSNGAFTFPANSLTAGKVIRVEAWGIYSTTGTPTLNFILRYGAAVTGVSLVVSGAVTTANNSSSVPWYLTATIAVRAVGATGTVAAFMSALFPVAAATNCNVTANQVISTNLIDTTTSTALTLAALWGTGNTLNTVTMTGITIEVLD